MLVGKQGPAADVAASAVTLGSGLRVAMLYPRRENGDHETLAQWDALAFADAYSEDLWKAAIHPDTRETRTLLAAVVEDAEDAVRLRLAGFATLLFAEERTRLRKVFVLPRYQRQGLGAAMVGRVTRSAVQADEYRVHPRKLVSLVPQGKRGLAMQKLLAGQGWRGKVAPDDYYEFTAPTGPATLLEVM